MENRQLGGIGFLICNAALFSNGLIAKLYGHTPESRKAGTGRMTSSVLWAGSAAFLAKYGDRPVTEQQARLEDKLADHLRREGVPLDAAMLRKADDHTRHGWFSKVEDFLYAHPIECANAYNAAAGIGYMVSGVLRRRDGNLKSGNANLGLSAIMLTGALASILIPEKTPEQIAAKGQSGTLWGKMQEHPLGYVRWLFLGGDVLDGMGAIGEFQGAKKLAKGDPYRTGQFAMAGLSVTAMVTALVSDWVTSGSKKAGGEPGDRDAAQQQLVNAAALQLAQLLPEQQQRLVQTVASYLTQQHELRFSDRDPKVVAEELLQRVHALTTGSATAPETKATLGTHTEKFINPAPLQQISRS